MLVGEGDSRTFGGLIGKSREGCEGITLHEAFLQVSKGIPNGSFPNTPSYFCSELRQPSPSWLKSPEIPHVLDTLTVFASEGQQERARAAGRQRGVGRGGCLRSQLAWMVGFRWSLFGQNPCLALVGRWFMNQFS